MCKSIGSRREWFPFTVKAHLTSRATLFYIIFPFRSSQRQLFFLLRLLPGYVLGASVYRWLSRHFCHALRAPMSYFTFYIFFPDSARVPPSHGILFDAKKYLELFTRGLVKLPALPLFSFFACPCGTFKLESIIFEE